MSTDKKSGPGGTAGGAGDRGGSQPKYSPNDDRSIVKNPTSPAHGADDVNRQKQAKGG